MSDEGRVVGNEEVMYLQSIKFGFGEYSDNDIVDELARVFSLTGTVGGRDIELPVIVHPESWDALVNLFVESKKLVPAK